MGNIAEVLPELVRRDVVPDVVTDQTAAHDLPEGYIPAGYSVEGAAPSRKQDPEGYREAVLHSMQRHVEAIRNDGQPGPPRLPTGFGNGSPPRPRTLVGAGPS